MFINFALELYQDDEQNYDTILEYAIQHAPNEDLVVKAQLDKKELNFEILCSYLKLYNASFNGLLRLSIKKILENKLEEVLVLLRNADDKKEATRLSYQAATITPETKDYIEFYLENAHNTFTNTDEFITVYASLNEYYDLVEQDENLLDHFVCAFSKNYTNVFGNEYLSGCLEFLTNQENLDQSQARIDQLNEILADSSEEKVNLWCKLFLLEGYRKLGVMDKVYHTYKSLVDKLGSDKLFDGFFAVSLKKDVSQILQLNMLLNDKYLANQYKATTGKKLSKKNVEQIREKYEQSILDAVKLCFDTPSDALKVLKTLGILNQDNLDLNVSVKFKKSEIDAIFDTWGYDVLICLCASTELPIEFANESLDEDTNTLKHQDDTNDNEQLDDIRSRVTVLLSEIDEICKSNDITYALYNCSIDSLNANKLPTAKIKVIMSVADFDKFVSLMQEGKRSDRSFECLKTNHSYQCFSAKYFDLNSTRINLLDPYSKIDAGICVEILPVCPLVHDRKLQKRLLETEVLTYTFKDIITSPKYLSAYLSARVKSLFTNKQKRANKLYCDLIDKYSSAKAKKYFVKEYGLSALVMNENPFDELLSFEVDGVCVNVPQKINDYLKAIKSLPKTNVYKNENNPINRVVSQNCKREEFISLYKKEIDEFAHAAKKQLNLQRIVTILNRRRKKNWAKANNIAHKFIHEQELILSEKDCTIKYQDYLKNLENSGAKALYFTKHL